MSNNTIIAIALVPVALHLSIMAALLVLQRFEMPAGLLPGGAVGVTILSIGFANILRIRRSELKGEAECGPARGVLSNRRSSANFTERRSRSNQVNGSGPAPPTRHRRYWTLVTECFRPRQPPLARDQHAAADALHSVRHVESYHVQRRGAHGALSIRL